MLTRGLRVRATGGFLLYPDFPWVAGCVMLLISGQIFCGIFGLGDNGRRTDRNWKGKYPKTAAAVFAVPFTCVTVDGAYGDDIEKDDLHKEILQRQHNGRGIHNSFCGLTISGGVYPICLHGP